jgi:DNA-binding SARP family transcriptional activator
VTPDGVDGPVEPLDFRVLGPLQVLRDGVDIGLRGDKPRAVLACC